MSPESPISICVVSPVRWTSRPRGVMYAFLNEKSTKPWISNASMGAGGGAFLTIGARSAACATDPYASAPKLSIAAAATADASLLASICYFSLVPLSNHLISLYQTNLA
jgi:hypothetical protein